MSQAIEIFTTVAKSSVSKQTTVATSSGVVAKTVSKTVSKPNPVSKTVKSKKTTASKDVCEAVRDIAKHLPKYFKSNNFFTKVFNVLHSTDEVISDVSIVVSIADIFETSGMMFSKDINYNEIVSNIFTGAVSNIKGSDSGEYSLNGEIVEGVSFYDLYRKMPRPIKEENIRKFMKDAFNTCSGCGPLDVSDALTTIISSKEADTLYITINKTEVEKLRILCKDKGTESSVITREVVARAENKALNIGYTKGYTDATMVATQTVGFIAQRCFLNGAMVKSVMDNTQAPVEAQPVLQA